MNIRRRRTAELSLVRDPEKWPLGFVLPLKRAIFVPDVPQFGFLVQTEEGPPEPVLYIGGFYDAVGSFYDAVGAQGKKLSTFEKRSYDSLEAILADGWIVD